MPNLEAIVAGIFRSHGYRVFVAGSTEGPGDGPQQAPLVIEKDARATAVYFEVPQPAATAQLLAADGCGRGILVHSAPVDVPAGFYHWDEDELCLQIGRAALRQVDGRPTSDPLEPRTAAPSAHAPDAAHADEAPPEDKAPQADLAPAVPNPRSEEAPRGDFEELPGRTQRAGSDRAPPSSPAPDEFGDFEELPGRHEAPGDPDPPEAPADYELLPGRNDAPAAPPAVLAPDDPGAELLTTTAQDQTTDPGGEWELMERAQDSGSVEAIDPRDLPTTLELPLPFRDTPEPGPSQGRDLKVHVTAAVARNLAKGHIGTITDLHLRLVPYHVFSYAARTLVKGRLDEREMRGHVAVDAWRRRVAPWGLALEPETRLDAVEKVVRRSVRVDSAEASSLARAELQEVIGRDIQQEEETDEWEVTVRRHVHLAPEHVDLQDRGLWFHPTWRASGPEGAVEIDAATGDILERERQQHETDAQLL